MVMACREKALIETPDFKLRDDASQMGKTRGGALRSEVSVSVKVRYSQVKAIC